MKKENKEVIRLMINGLFVLMAAFLVKHYYDIGLVTSQGVVRASIMCMIHIIYIGVTSVKRVYDSQKEA